MRVVGSFPDSSLAFQFSAFLIKKGIENHIEPTDKAYYVWVEDEDELERAHLFFLDFDPAKVGHLDIRPPPPPSPRRRYSSKKVTLHQVFFVTKLMIFFCILIFGMNQVAGDTSITKWLLFEWPTHYPYWEGIYDQLATHRFLQAPLFVQIREGQVWRLVTPIFLHANFLHILFNMLWLWSLGKQVERRLGVLRYIVLMVIVAVISNVSQYLMSGPLFMGYSGVVAGLAGFIYMRQKQAPWEGYQIHPSTFLFLALFIFGLAFLQGVAFFVAFFGWGTFNVSVANTAHIMGAFTGILLAKLRWFH